MRTKPLPGGIIVGIVALGALALLVILFVVFAPKDVTQKTKAGPIGFEGSSEALSAVVTRPRCMCECNISYQGDTYPGCSQPWDFTEFTPQCPDPDYPPGYVPTEKGEEITDPVKCSARNGRGCRGYIARAPVATTRLAGTLSNCTIHEWPVENENID